MSWASGRGRSSRPASFSRHCARVLRHVASAQNALTAMPNNGEARSAATLRGTSPLSALHMLSRVMLLPEYAICERPNRPAKQPIASCRPSGTCCSQQVLDAAHEP